MKWNYIILFVREERYSLIDRNTNSTMKICFFFLFNFLQLHEIIYFLPCIFENTVFSQKFVGKIGAPIFNRLIPPSLALAGSHLFKFEETERWLWSSSLGSLTTPHLPASPFLLHYRTWNALATYRRSSFIILGPETRRLPCYSRRTDGIKGWRVFIDLWLGRSVDNYWTIGFPRWNSVYTMDGSVHPSSAAASEVSKLEMLESLLNHLDVWVPQRESKVDQSFQEDLAREWDEKWSSWAKWKTDILIPRGSSRVIINTIRLLHWKMRDVTSFPSLFQIQNSPRKNVSSSEDNFSMTSFHPHFFTIFHPLARLLISRWKYFSRG